MISIYKTTTFQDIVKRFDVLHQNNRSYSEKIRYLYFFEKWLFPDRKMIEKSFLNECSIQSFEQSEPEIGFPLDEVYISALASYCFSLAGKPDLAAAHSALTAKYVTEALRLRARR